MTKAEQEKPGLQGRDKRQGDLQNAPGDDDIPEGLLRPRKGPYDKTVGRMEEASEAPRAFPDRNPAKKKTGEFYFMASTIKAVPKKQTEDAVQQSRVGQ